MLLESFSFISRLIGRRSRRNKYGNRSPLKETKMNNRVVLTYEELRVLQAFGSLEEAAIPQLALEARLTPTEMGEAISRLVSKNLVKTEGNDYFVQLTSFGSAARGNYLLDSESVSSSSFHPKSAHSQSSGSSTSLEREKTM
jgi:DNA-binding MarR family transcriptional regulator